MNKTRIYQLVRLMPVESTGFILHLINKRPSTRRFAERIAVATNDPDFGYKFVAAHLRQQKALPASVTEQPLRSAYSHYAGTNRVEDLVMAEVEELLLPASQFIRAVLHALLICRDATIPQIAEWLSLSKDAVHFYEQLHFNVRDRLDEKVFIASIVFPRGRTELLKTDAVDDLSFEQRLLQAGYLHGADEVLILAGMNTDAELPSQEESKREFEASILANANRLARNGYLNSTSSPGINHAKSILATQAQASQQAVVTDDYKIGLGSLNMSPKDVIRSPADAIQYTLDGIRAHQNGQTVKQMTDEELAKEDEEIRAMHQAVLKANKAAVN